MNTTDTYMYDNSETLSYLQMWKKKGKKNIIHSFWILRQHNGKQITYQHSNIFRYWHFFCWKNIDITQINKCNQWKGVPKWRSTAPKGLITSLAGWGTTTKMRHMPLATYLQSHIHLINNHKEYKTTSILLAERDPKMSKKSIFK